MKISIAKFKIKFWLFLNMDFMIWLSECYEIFLVFVFMLILNIHK